MLSKKLEIIKNQEKLLQENLSKKNLLIIGAGGIGCELLKCLVMIGIKKITIIDLDKVEKSNLNRQFLFEIESVGKFKSNMAIESIIKMTGKNDLVLNSYIGNIKNIEQFNFEFFEKFDLILNALDNIDARSYINRICLMKSIPLINSGTEGFLGNVFCFYGKKTACYDCSVKIKQKTIPICSIRSKPEKIEHCIAWAKALLELLFVKEEVESNPLSDYLSFFNDYNFNQKEGINEISEKCNNQENVKYDNVIKKISILFQKIFFDGVRNENCYERMNIYETNKSFKDNKINEKDIEIEKVDINEKKGKFLFIK